MWLIVNAFHFTNLVQYDEVVKWSLRIPSDECCAFVPQTIPLGVTGLKLVNGNVGGILNDLEHMRVNSLQCGKIFGIFI